MCDIMKLILDVSKIKENEDIHQTVLNIEKKLHDEHICASLFSMVIDAKIAKSNIYRIPKIQRTNKIYTQFKVYKGD